MPSNKDRLYIGLYARAGKPIMPGLEDTYHWGLMTGPRNETKDSIGRRFHAKEKMRLVDDPPRLQSIWEYEELETSMQPNSMLLVRILVAKVKDADRLNSILRNVPIRSGAPGWNCVSWVQEAVETVLRDERASSARRNLAWETMRDAAMRYIAEKKAAHRFDGQGDFDTSRAPTWDAIEELEHIP